MKATLKVTSDFTEDFNAIIKRFQKDRVLVGIPEEDDSRKPYDSESGAQENNFGNAAILAINHFGSEEAHIPPRPVLSTGIRNAQAPIAAEFKKATIGALSEGLGALDRAYERAGIIAANSCKKVINDQEGLLAPADSTLRARKYLTKSGFKGEKALLVTGQVRNAITYVVKK